MRGLCSDALVAQPWTLLQVPLKIVCRLHDSVVLLNAFNAKMQRRTEMFERRWLK